MNFIQQFCDLQGNPFDFAPGKAVCVGEIIWTISMNLIMLSLMRHYCLSKVAMRLCQCRTQLLFPILGSVTTR